MNKLVGLRSSLSMTQTDMANYLGISTQSYWNKENGRRPFSDNEKIKIKNLFLKYEPSITIEELFFNNKVLK
ncbi:hypothetical protein HMPREF2811_02580 [Globicatella sp. HMSC072A10]|uniref:helix-turn-helix transcriptional regulator n=1 Tax=Globicatella sp. HMSC072A10 TaxID=1739315 RepID=UPI0008D3849E|nr:hypothetical protein [Globicatella sp. HMSC072A10]OFK62563.1 hypothetical protein HMPREF2811_02580 [Globicatella sp. HMSC072A10]